MIKHILDKSKKRKKIEQLLKKELQNNKQHFEEKEKEYL